MTHTYYALIEKQKDYHTVTFPAFGITGRAFAGAEESAAFAGDFLAEIILDWQEKKRRLPDQERAAKPTPAGEETGIMIPVEADTALYRSRIEQNARRVFYDFQPERDQSGRRGFLARPRDRRITGIKWTEERRGPKNILRRIDELQNIMNQRGRSLSDAERAGYTREMDEMKTILTWVGEQCTRLGEGDYNSETRELKFEMKNTTRYHFKTLSFTLIAGEGTEIPVTAIDWRPRELKTIYFYYDFNSDWSYRTMREIRLKNRADSVEYELMDPESEGREAPEEAPVRERPAGYSKNQGYLVSVRSFCGSVRQLDLRAKARQLEAILIDLFDIMGENPNQREQTRKFRVVYLPAVNRVLTEYQKAELHNTPEDELAAMGEKVHETLDTALTAFRNLRVKLQSGKAESSGVELEIMKRLMREEGLL